MTTTATAPAASVDLAEFAEDAVQALRDAIMDEWGGTAEIDGQGATVLGTDGNQITLVRSDGTRVRVTMTATALD